MKVLITGADGFIGKNLRLHLVERKDVEVVYFDVQHSTAYLPEMLNKVEFVFHLAGVNRPQDFNEFAIGNHDLTRTLCEAICAIAETTRSKIPILLTSSTQANLDNPYGRSKRGAEEAVFSIARSHGISGHVFRLPNVFGKWCRPNYNSAIATFCHNVSRGLPIQIHDPTAAVTLVYVEDLLKRFIQLMDGADSSVDAEGFEIIFPQYTTTIGEIARLVYSFKESRNTLTTDRVGTGLVRALYSTYISYQLIEKSVYDIPQHRDPRGVFVEMLKTPDCGQFSYFTVLPGITRGGHYHYSKTEKFLVVSGQARFRFRHMHTGESYELVTSAAQSQIVQTLPGWIHDITNIGSNEMIVMLWANEVFDPNNPDTFSCPL